MHWRLLVSLLPHLLVCDSLAGPVIYEAFEDDVAAVGSLIREVRQPAPLRVATEAEDLTGASNAQRESRDTKKRAKNASGTFAIRLVTLEGYDAMLRSREVTAILEKPRDEWFIE
jgi:hypothetical protein